MRIKPLVGLVLAVWTGSGVAQPLDGDVVLSLLDSTAFAKGAVVYLNPANPGTLNTLSANVTPGSFPNWVRMAPNNTDLVVAEVGSGFGSSRLVSIDPSGTATTIAAGLPGGINGFELDGDDTWIVAGSSAYVLGVQHARGTWSTFVRTAWFAPFNEMCILREQGHTYIIAIFTSSTFPAAKFYSADRNGIVSTLMITPGNPLLRLSGVEVDPKTGDLITTDFEGPSSAFPEPKGTEVNRVNLGGKVTSLVTFGVNGCKVNQDDTVWLGGFARLSPSTNVRAVMKFDLSTRTVVTVVRLGMIPATLPISAVEVYGSHPLTCNGRGGPGQSIAVNLKSHRAAAAGAPYQLACSFGRRPGLQLPNGEWLHLNVTDNLFLLTARNLAPALFPGFSGKLDMFGRAQARIKLPASFPANLGLTVFCAGVIYTPQGVVQVTNTHWFAL